MVKKRYFTKGQMEADISDALIRFEKEFMGRGPLETKTFVLGDMVIVRMRGVLTNAEKKLIKSDRRSRGRDLIKQTRTELIESGRPLLESVLKSITKRKVRSMHTDVSTVSDEKVFVFVFEKNIEFD